MHSFYFQALIYLLAAVISVPLAKRFGLGSVLGYLIAGVIMGPHVLGLIGEEGHDLMHIAEFGVVMMLFLVGLELRPALLWELRGSILGMGGLQVVATALVIGVAAMFCGLGWQPSLAIGLIFAMSSTAIVLQSLNEKGLMKTPGGEACFSVLLFQDLSLIPILALLPLLDTLPPAESAGHLSNPLAGFPGWEQGLFVLGAVVTIILAGRFLLRPIFRYIASTELREMFTATTLLLVVGIAELMQSVGLSAALGTFLAGVVLAESEYRHELEADIEPFKGLLLGLFFIAVGAGIDFTLLAHHPVLIAGLVAGVLILKFLVLLGLGRGFRLEPGQSFLFAFALAQGGEFAFVLFSYAKDHGVLAPDLANMLTAVVALSMAAAPLLFMVDEKLVQSRFTVRRAKRQPDKIDEHENPVLLAGFGRFGHVVGRLLRANGFPTTVLDHDPDQVDALRRFGMKSFYGDASRLDMLRNAGAEKAKIFILAIDDEVRSLEIIRTVQANFPHLQILARANSRQHAYELLKLGVNDVFRETFGSALDLGVAALRTLGVRAWRAHRAARIFREYDEASMRELATLLGDEQEYLSRARQHVENLEQVLRTDEKRFGNGPDPQWDEPYSRTAEPEAK